jgi:hypothetical protein
MYLHREELGGNSLKWDPAKWEFVGNDEANRWQDYPYPRREGYDCRAENRAPAPLECTLQRVGPGTGSVVQISFLRRRRLVRGKDLFSPQEMKFEGLTRAHGRSHAAYTPASGAENRVSRSNFIFAAEATRSRKRPFFAARNEI